MRSGTFRRGMHLGLPHQTIGRGMPVRRLRPIVFVLAVAAAMACGTSGDVAQLSETHDDFGIPLPPSGGQSAGRVVSLGPATTEIIAGLGALDRLVGRSIWDTWPAEVTRVPELGDALRPSAERVLAARPDLVVLDARPDNQQAAAVLRNANVPVVALRVDRVDQFLNTLTILGSLLNARARSDSLRRTLQATLDSVRQTRSGARPTVFLPVWNAPLMTVGSGSFLSELVAIAGAKNLYEERIESAFVVSPEDVSRRDPDVILVAPASAAEWSPGGRWAALRAVRTGRVLTYDTTLVGQPSLRMGLAAVSLARLFDSTRAVQ